MGVRPSKHQPPMKTRNSPKKPGESLTPSFFKPNAVHTAGKNKKLILEFIQALNEAEDKLSILSQYTSDPNLTERITFLEQAFPHYQVRVDEVMAEENRVIIRARFIGEHQGPVNGMAPTGEKVELPYAIGYQLDKGKIVSHWMITDWAVLAV